MTAIHESEVLRLSRDVPLELQRLASSTHPSDEANIASRLSGVIATRTSDDVICPLMVNRHLVVSSRQIHGSRSSGCSK
jgi:hypothetical protein